jgi:puromycin-sensitive aminopeptidase
MKTPILSAALICAAAASSLANTAARLPAGVRPVRYAITLQPDLAGAKFSGEESVTVEIAAPTASITLHSVELEIAHASVKAGGQSQVAKVVGDAANEMITLTVAKPIEKGTAVLDIKFAGKLGHELRGLYAAESGGRKFAFTQFEATYARRAFPCFDEPQLKAKFALTVVTEAGNSAVSNGKISGESSSGGHKTIRFAETPPISSYLVALGVGPLVEVKGPHRDGRTTVRLIGPPGAEKLAGYTLETATALLDKLEDYFGIKYPFGKLDLVAVPDFAAGGMENAGAIFCRDSYLLLDEKTTSAEARRYTAALLAHEMSHMWFGDLVTMKWWDDLWLNEAFATWAEDRMLDDWKPEWQSRVATDLWREEALGIDAMKSSHAIRQPVSTPEEVEDSFDSITYAKGASVLRMLELFVGEAKFRDGVRSFLKAHANGNATAADLFQALGEVSGQPIGEIASSWVDQPGFPMLKTHAKCQDGKVTLDLEQRQFFLDGTQRSPRTWIIPVCASSAGKSSCKLMRSTKAQITIDAPSCDLPVVVNAGNAGYYRVAYEPSELQRVASEAERSLTPAERFGLLADAWATTVEGSTPLGAYLGVAEGLKGEHNRDVLELLSVQVEYLDDHLLAADDAAPFHRFVDRLFRPVVTDLGWDAKVGEGDAVRMARGEALIALGRIARSPDVIAEAIKRLPRFLDDQSALDGSVGEAVVAIGAATGDAARFDSYVTHLRAAKTPEEHQRILWSMALFEPPQLVQRELELTLSADVKVQDVPRLLARLLDNPRARAASWAFLKQRFDDVLKRSPPFSMQRVVTASGDFCDAERAAEVRKFFTEHKVEAVDREILQAEESSRACAAFKKRSGAQLSGWLHGAGSHAQR